MIELDVELLQDEDDDALLAESESESESVSSSESDVFDDGEKLPPLSHRSSRSHSISLDKLLRLH